MGGGQTQTKNSIQTSETSPWNPAQPGLMQVLNDSKTLYEAGIGSQIYGGPRVADYTTDQSAGIQSVRDQAASDNAGALGTAYLQNTLASNGISPTTQQGLNMLAAVPEASTARLSGLADWIGSASNPINQTANSFMSGARDLTTQPQLQGLFNQTQLPSYAETNLAGVARGDYLDPTTNPYVQALVQNANQNASDATKQAYAASGRYGSGNFAGAMTKAISDVDTNLYANQYNTERQNQLSANQLTDAARMSRLGLGESLTNDISNVQSVNNQQRLAGAGLGVQQEGMQSNVLGQVLSGDQFNSNLGVTKANGFIGAGQQGLSTALQAAGLLPATDALRYAPANNLLQIGGLQQGQNQNQINAAREYFTDTQTVPWQALSEYASFPTAIGSMGGQSVSRGTEQTKTSGVSPLQSILGLGTSLLGLGTGGGSTLGGGLLSGLFGSDERLKENVKEVGELHDGQKLYSYNYKGDPRTQVGLLAQEVAEKKPDAVGPLGIGDMLGVDYAKATEDAAKQAPGGGSGSSASTTPAAPSSPSTASPEALKGIGQMAAAQMAGPMMQAAMQALNESPAAKPKAVMMVVQSKVAGKAAKGGKSSKSSKAA